MARKIHDDAFGVAGAETIIGTGVTIKGNLKTDSDIVIDGQLNGNIMANGNVTAGVNSRVNGQITGSNITIAGELVGNIVAEGEVSILSTGQIRGNITCGSLAIGSGAIFIGESHMQAAPEAVKHTESTDENHS